MRKLASKLSASLALAALLLPAPAPAADKYTVFAELLPPYRIHRPALAQALKKEGYELHAESDREVALILTAAQIRELFRAKVTYRRVGKSSGPGMAEEAYLEAGAIPPRFARYIRRVYFDPQRS